MFETRSRFASDASAALSLFEWRARMLPPHEWTEFSVTKFTYIATKRTWKLMRMDRNLRWQKCEWADETAKVGLLLKKVDHDPYCFFWG